MFIYQIFISGFSLRLQIIKIHNLQLQIQEAVAMLPSGYRPHLFTRQPHNTTRDSIIRSQPPTTYRQQTWQQINNSPRAPPDLNRDRENSMMQLGEKMRMMKSKIGNLSINSRNGINQNNLYPTELIFLLSNEQANVDRMRQLIQDEKKRVNRDFENFSREILHLIEDLKLSFHSQLDFVFRDFIAIYGSLKTQVVRMRQTRKHILQSNQYPEYQPLRSPRQQPQPSNPNTSNLNLLQQISRDQQYFKNHRIYEQVTNAYMQAIGPIMQEAQNIISIGSQQQFYKDQKCNQILNNIRNSFFNSTKVVFQSELDQLVLQTKEIIQDSNMLLKDLGVEEARGDRLSVNANQYGNGDKYRVNGYNNNSNVNSNVNVNANIKNKKRADTQSNPYGFQPPTFKNNFYQQQNEKSRGLLRPSSSTDNMKFRTISRPQSNWSSKKGNLDLSRQKYNNFNSPNRQIRRSTRDGQNIIVESGQFTQINRSSTIICQYSQDILLCVSFVNQGKHIAVGSKDKNIYVFSTSNGKFVQKLIGHQASICFLACFGGFLVSGGDNGCCSLILWDTQQWKMKKKANLHSAALTCIVDLQDGNHLATGGYDKRIHVYNYKRGQKVFEVNSCRSGVTSLVLCEQSRKLLSASLDSTMTIWNVFTRNGELQSITLDRIITSCGLVCSLRPLALAHDLVIFGNKDGKISFLNIHSGQIVRTLAVSRSSVIELTAIERQTKPQNPFILSCSSGQREMMLTRTDTGGCQSTKVRINIGFGCGIGPKVVIDQSGIMAIVNQSEGQKQVVLYNMEIS